MTRLSQKLKAIEDFIRSNEVRSVSFDIDGTVYPIVRVQRRWWWKLVRSFGDARRFYLIKRTWEGRRKGDAKVPVTEADIDFFENFLVSLLDPELVPGEIRVFIDSLVDRKIEVFFLSDHGARAKLAALGLGQKGPGINCLVETGQLKPHEKISGLLAETYRIEPRTHLHLGDRWTDEEQARLFGCAFRYLRT